MGACWWLYEWSCVLTAIADIWERYNSRWPCHKCHECCCGLLQLFRKPECSVQFKVVSLHSEKPICAPPHLSQCFLPLKQFQWQWKHCLEDVWRPQKRISLCNLHFQKVWRKYCFPSPAPSKTTSPRLYKNLKKTGKKKRQRKRRKRQRQKHRRGDMQ